MYFLDFYHIKNLSRSDFQRLVHKLLDIQLVPVIIFSGLLIQRMLGDIIFVRQKWTYTSKLQDALVTIHGCDFIYGHEILPTLPLVHGMIWIVL